MATYWRIFITANNSSDYTGIGDIQFYQTLGGDTSRIETVGGTASSSSAYSSAYNADKAFDGVNSTGWSTVINEMPCWIQYQFPSHQEINELILYSAPSLVFTNPHLQAPNTFKLQSSNNGTDWTDVLSYSGVTWDGPYQEKKFFLKSPVRIPLVKAIRRDMQFGGPYLLSGIVLNGAYPAELRLRLFDQQTGLLIRELWSVNGRYSFNYIANQEQGYFITCFNHLEQKAATQMNLMASAM